MIYCIRYIEYSIWTREVEEMKKSVSIILTASMMISLAGTGIDYTAFASEPDDTSTALITYNYDGSDHQRRMENLDRGLVAVNTDNGVFLSWRLLGNECSVGDVAIAPDFTVYKNGVELAKVEDSTNYLDESGSADDVYTVAIDGGEQCEGVIPLNNNYIEIPLVRPEDEIIQYDNNGVTESMGPLTFMPSDASCGDLDGDGEYEIIVKWTSNEKDVGEPGNPAYSGTVKFAAYKLDGTKLWDKDISLGKNVYSSAHTVQFLVYDFDGDGKAEMTCQTSLGSTDGTGKYVTQAADPQTNPDIYNITDEENETTDFRGDGRIITGQEFLTVFNGETGEAMDTINLPTERVSADSFGDDFGNRCNRFLADVAYLDGERPYAVYWRGYYGGRNGRQRTSVCGVAFDGERLSCEYNFDTLYTQPGYREGNENYTGQGNHNLTVADVDDDGMDEIISGALCLENDGSSDLAVKWCTFRGHGDAMHIGDYDPTHKGLEFFTVHEGTSTVDGVTFNYGMSVIDPATGEILFHNDGSKDTGRGLMANMGMGGYYQISGASGSGNYVCEGNGSYANAPANIGTNFRVFWNGDLYDDSLDGTNVSSWDGSRMRRIFSADGCTSVNGTKNTPSLQADLFGDWREELVYPANNGSSLRVYTTTDITNYKLPTLMHDPVYRSGVAAEQTAYNQPPHIGFYLAEEIFKPDVESLEVTKAPDKLVYNVGEAFDETGMEITAHYVDGSSEVVTGYTVTGFDSTADKVQYVTISFGDVSVDLEVEVDSGFTIDEDGMITGYQGDATEAVLPDSIDDVEVKGFADSALQGSSLSKITVNAYYLTIGNSVFPDGITIVCMSGSDIFNYAMMNNIKTETIDTRDFTVNVTYDEEEYAGLNMVQDVSSQNTQIGHISYSVGGRDASQGGGDGASGFVTEQTENGAALKIGIGQFSDRGRGASMIINDLPSLSDSTDSVFETKIMFHDKDETGRDGSPTVLRAKITISDDTGEVDTLSTSLLGLESDTWYTYKLVCMQNTYYRYIYDSDGALISSTVLGKTESERPANTFKFEQESGDFGQGRNTYVMFDDTKVYNNIEIANALISIRDENGEPVAGADVTIGNEHYTSDIKGEVSFASIAGSYKVDVSADGYEDTSVNFGMYRRENEISLVMVPKYVDVTGIEFGKETISMIVGDKLNCNAKTVPQNATEQGILFTSSDDSVVSVNDSGILTANKAGTAVITASSVKNPDIKAEIPVTVYEDNYEQQASSIEITGPEKVYIPNTGNSYSDEFTVIIYDQNGVIIPDKAVLTTSNGLQVDENNRLVVSAGTDTGKITVTAEYGGVSASTETELVNIYNGYSEIASETLDQEFLIDQTTDTMQVDTDDIYYEILGGRSSGNDTAFEVNNEISVDGRKVLTVKAGRWADNNRCASMTFKNAPDAYSDSVAYIMSSDMKVSGDMYAVMRDANGDEIFRVNAESMGIDQNKWYHVEIIYSDNKYTLAISDSDKNIVSITDISTQNHAPIKSIIFLKGEVQKSVMYLDGFRYFTTDNAFSTAVIKTIDKNGDIVANVPITSGSLSGNTDDTGKVYFDLPVGIYNFTADFGDDKENVQVSATDDFVYYTVLKPWDSEIEGVDGNIITAQINGDDEVIYAASYDETGVLKSLKSMEADVNESEYDAGFTPDKVFIWKTDMTPVDLWTAE